MHLSDIVEPAAYIGAAGFEDRALAVLERAANESKKIDHVVGIQYLPFDKRNRVDEFNAKVAKLGVSNEQFKRLTYNRCYPQEFVSLVEDIKAMAEKVSSLIIDISAMSKFLIVTLLQSLRNIPVRVEIAYAEADIYHPTRDVFEWQKQLQKEATPEFLTTDIYKIVTTTSLSSSSMQGYPLLIVAFPTFNYRELLALLNEITPHHFILLEGKPHESHNAWRLEAIRRLNRIIEENVLTTRTISTFDYLETLTALEEIYQDHHHTHKFLVSPTGSKLQTFSVFLFRQMHPDIQLIYPVTREFASEYTSGCSAIWQISIPCLADLVGWLDTYRKQSLLQLKAGIANRLRRQRT